MDLYVKESEVGTYIHGDTCVLYLWPLVGCVSSTFMLLTCMQYPTRGDNQPASYLGMSGAKKVNILRL